MDRPITILTLVHPKDFYYLKYLFSSLVRQDIGFNWVILVDGFGKLPIDLSKMRNVDIIYYHNRGKNIPIEGPRYPYLLNLGLKYVRYKYGTEWMCVLDSDVYLSANYLSSSIKSGYDMTIGKLYEVRGSNIIMIRTRYGDYPYSGAALVFRRSVFDSLTIYPFDGCDYIFIISAMLKGFRVGINMDAYYVHLKPQVGWRRFFKFGFAYAKSGYHTIYIIGKAFSIKPTYSLPFFLGVLQGSVGPNYFPDDVCLFNKFLSLNIVKNILIGGD